MLIRWAKSTLFQCHERRRFHVDSMSVCCLGSKVGKTSQANAIHTSRSVWICKV